MGNTVVLPCYVAFKYQLKFFMGSAIVPKGLLWGVAIILLTLVQVAAQYVAG